MTDDEREKLYILATSLAKVRAAYDIAASAATFVPEAREACRVLGDAADRLHAEWERLRDQERPATRLMARADNAGVTFRLDQPAGDRVEGERPGE